MLLERHFLEAVDSESAKPRRSICKAEKPIADASARRLLLMHNHNYI